MTPSRPCSPISRKIARSTSPRRSGPVDFQDSPFDAAIQRAALARSGTTIVPLMDERLVVVAAPGLLPRTALSPAGLTGFPLIQQATRPRLWAAWFAAADLGPVDRLRGPPSSISTW